MICARLVISSLLAAMACTANAQSTAPKLKGVWEPVNYSEDLRLVDVFFVTPETGYVSGAAGTILKTTDAGATWTALLGGDPQSQEREITQLFFLTSTTGWAAQVTSSHTNLFRTIDGDMWSKVGTIPEHYEDFAFASESVGVYINDEKIFRTTDAGKNWRETGKCAAKAEVDGFSRNVVCHLWELQFVTPSVAYALGRTIGGVNAAVVVKSVDGGETWSLLPLIPDESGWEGGLFFIDENTGYASMKDAKSAYRTTDGGQTWSGMPAASIGNRVVFADPEVGWALYYNRLAFTADGGKRWSSRDLQLPAMPNAFSLPRRDRAYAVGDHGMIYRYSVLTASTPVAAKALEFPAMPGLDNAVLAQIAKLETGLEKVDGALDAAAAGTNGAAAGGDWSSSAVDQQLAQLQATVDTVTSGVPAMGRKHRNLNLAMFGLQLLGDLTGQSGGLKQAFTSLVQSKDAASASTALQSLHGQLDAMKTSVESFKSFRKAGS